MLVQALTTRMGWGPTSVLKHMGSFDLTAIPGLNQLLVLELARCQYVTDPGCDAPSNARHSTYQRHLQDLPLQGRLLPL